MGLKLWSSEWQSKIRTIQPSQHTTQFFVAYYSTWPSKGFPAENSSYNRQHGLTRQTITFHLHRRPNIQIKCTQSTGPSKVILYCWSSCLFAINNTSAMASNIMSAKRGLYYMPLYAKEVLQEFLQSESGFPHLKGGARTCAFVEQPIGTLPLCHWPKSSIKG